MKADIQLQRDILDELEWEPSIDAAEIGVTVDDGVARLDGRVPSYTEKLAAERAALRVAGVKAVANDVEVKSREREGPSTPTSPVRRPTPWRGASRFRMTGSRLP